MFYAGVHEKILLLVHRAFHLTRNYIHLLQHYKTHFRYVYVIIYNS